MAVFMLSRLGKPPSPLLKLYKKHMSFARSRLLIYMVGGLASPARQSEIRIIQAMVVIGRKMEP